MPARRTRTRVERVICKGAACAGVIFSGGICNGAAIAGAICTGAATAVSLAKGASEEDVIRDLTETTAVSICAVTRGSDNRIRAIRMPHTPSIASMIRRFFRL